MIVIQVGRGAPVIRTAHAVRILWCLFFDEETYDLVLYSGRFAKNSFLSVVQAFFLPFSRA